MENKFSFLSPPSHSFVSRKSPLHRYIEIPVILILRYWMTFLEGRADYVVPETVFFVHILGLNEYSMLGSETEHAYGEIEV